MHFRIATLAAATLMAGTGIAQTPTAAPAGKTAAATAKPAKAPVVRTAKSLDCSKQADAKSLHGKPRKSFMSSCKRA